MGEYSALEQFEEEGKHFAFVQKREQEILNKVIDLPEFEDLSDLQWDVFIERNMDLSVPVESIDLTPPPKIEYKELSYSLLYDLYIKDGYAAKAIAKFTQNEYATVNAKIRQYGLAKIRKGMQ